MAHGKQVAKRVLVGALGLSLLLAAAGCKGKDAAAKASPSSAPAVLTVSTTPVAERGMGQMLEITGSVAGWDPMPVLPAANGLRVTRVLVEEGDYVRKGQVLVQLDDAMAQAQYRAAQARAQVAEQNHRKAISPHRRQDLATAEATLAQAEANYRQADDMLRRVREVAREGGVSAVEVVSRETAAVSAKAVRDQAAERLSMMREGSRSEDLQIAAAQAAEARAAASQAAVALAQTRVVAPAEGRIIKRDARLGDLASAGKPFFQMVRNGRLEMTALVPEGDLVRLAVGMDVKVGSDAMPDVKETGTIRLISPSVDASSRQATVHIDLPVGSRFDVGMFVRGQAELGSRRGLSVPASAVVTKDTGSEVFVLENGIAHSRRVEVSGRQGTWVAISGGLKPGEEVIVNGVGFLKDGDKVDVVPALGDQPASASDVAPAGATAPEGGASDAGASH